MKMTPFAVVIGSLLILAAVVCVVVVLPYSHTSRTPPSDLFRQRTAEENKGREIYIANGCVYCHTQSIRSIDWGMGAERIAQAGDYLQDRPILLGSARTGPDLSQEGGEHPDDWHVAHFLNPRWTRPLSIMPSFSFLAPDELDLLIRHVQSLGLIHGDQRMERQAHWKQEAIRAYEAGPKENAKWLAEMVPEGWRRLPNPYPATAAALARGHKIYQDFCLGCHGPIGDGMGPAQPHLYPPPLNFTTLKGTGHASGGLLYYQIMNGITGTAMPYFKKDLESEKIWDVGHYIAVNFIDESDANADPKGIDASYEPE